MAHSKRNTSLAFFTTHERSQLKSAWGSQSTRLTRDSFLPFASCNLCLQPSRDPVACASDGDIFCRECIVSNLLAQRKEIKRLEKEEGRRKREVEDEEKGKMEEEKERSVREFERTMMGLEGREGRSNGTTATTTDERRDIEVGRGVKRKFELDEEEMVKNAKEERAKARKAIEDEKVIPYPLPLNPTNARLMMDTKSSKPTLPAFWLPSLTPSTDTNKASSTPLKLSPICPASSPSAPHPLSLKSLITISFSTSTSTSASNSDTTTNTDSSNLICPACNKPLSNASKAMLTVPCGHVLCKPCAQKFMTLPEKPAPDPHAANGDAEEEAARCYVCETELTEEKAEGKKRDKKKDKDKGLPRRGLVEMRSEGTGFAGGGKNMAKREGVAFQC
ncbi:MAG: hypothetical protein LQ338_003442 [Usnochroma carphineum]|nr:MAG: hypothetical protein LQ338_003442 [Usnochroma carphineum]